ncbi:MAG: protocatechuate 3,4-dioxygenase, partial [Planctomycetaceae bacterium]
MSKRGIREQRRQFLKQAAFGAAMFSTSGLFAEELTQTPRQTEGPFYPDSMPLDTDNDLLIINDKITPGLGTVTHLTGRVLEKSGTPVRNATVEIWQADANGIYIHSGSGTDEERDGNFQGYGRFLTGGKGEYYFRTIKPIAYRRRTPHVHMIVKAKGKRMLTTEMYVKGAAQNDGDPVL